MKDKKKTKNRGIAWMLRREKAFRMLATACASPPRFLPLLILKNVSVIPKPLSFKYEPV